MADSLSYDTLTPISFLDRAASAHGDRVAVVDRDMSFTYTELRDRCVRLARAVAGAAADRPCAVLVPNSHVMIEAHFGVPMGGVPLVAINTRLSAGEVAHILRHSNAGTLLYDASLAELATAAATQLPDAPRMIRSSTGADDEYEAFLRSGTGEPVAVRDERSVISINYTSGTTGSPKGVLYHHRGAYLQALAMVAHTGLSPSSTYLWTLPMFHCNGWTFPWAVTAAGATHVCLPRVDPAEAWRLIREHEVTHLCGAPTVLSMLAYADGAGVAADRPAIEVMTGGAPPSPTILERMAALGFTVTHLYGLTETYGPAVVCDWRPEWNTLDPAGRARRKARQGVGNLLAAGVRVLKDGADVPRDGTTVGEIAFRGNNVMLGYLNDPEATRAAAPDGWFRSGDLGVVHPDGYLELRDRSKDIIVSGGENIASVEVEQVIAAHPAVLEVAVVAAPDPKWGEVPVAYVAPHPGRPVSDEEIVAHVKAHLASYKAPKKVVFADLPHTSTGKIQKFLLREQEWAGTGRRIQ